jgi:deoxyribose-phosphate aldolase
VTPADPARIVGLIDLTSLDESDSADVIGALCDRAVTPLGPVAAVCVLPRFVAQCADRLDGTGVRIATVANFPGGEPDPDGAARTTAAAVLEGADEVDVVAPWRAFLDGREDVLGELVRACADECEHLKVILETGSHPDPATTRRMAEAAVGAGAAFLKTSTGKVGQGATLEATRLLLEVTAGRAGVKASGGIRATADAQAHVALADELAPGPATAQTFRLGASSLLADLLA